MRLVQIHPPSSQNIFYLSFLTWVCCFLQIADWPIFSVDNGLHSCNVHGSTNMLFSWCPGILIPPKSSPFRGSPNWQVCSTITFASSKRENIFWNLTLFNIFLTEIHVDSPIVKQGFAKLWHVRMKSINLTWFGLRPSIILLICDNFSLERCGEICLVWSMCRDWIRFLKHWCCLLEMFTIFRIALEWVRNFFHVAPPPHCSIGFDVLLLLLCSRSLHVDN